MNFLQKIAPFLGAALSLGGPAGTLAGQLLNKAVGVKPDASIAEVSTAVVGATADQIAAIRQAEEQFQLQMKSLDIQSIEEMEKIGAEDRANARARQIAVPSDKTPTVLAFVITLGFFGTLWFVCIHGIKPEASTLTNVMVGALGTAWVGVVSYYFGSSAGSARKTELLAAAPAITTQ